MISDDRAVEPLIAALEDEEWSVRRSAAEALGLIGDESAVALLIFALEDENASVRESAYRALEKIRFQ